MEARRRPHHRRRLSLGPVDAAGIVLAGAVLRLHGRRAGRHGAADMNDYDPHAAELLAGAHLSPYGRVAHPVAVERP